MVTPVKTPRSFKPAEAKRKKNVKEFKEDEELILKHPWRNKVRTRYRLPVK